MLFKRAHRRPLRQRIGNFFWPRAGIRRSLRYLGYRLVRLDASAHSIAAGVASGVAVSCTPFIGLHFLCGFLLAFLTRGHLLASMIGTFAGNPWTFPFLFSSTGAIGGYLLGEPVSADIVILSLNRLFTDPIGYASVLVPLLKPFIIGAIPLGIVAWGSSYVLVRRLVEHYRRRKTPAIRTAAIKTKEKDAHEQQ